MKMPARSLFSATTALGLLSFTLISASITGVASTVTQLAFGLSVIHGVLEIALISYAPRRFLERPATSRPVPARAASPVVVRVPAVIEYQVCRSRAA